MEEERKILINETFLQLKKIARERFVEVTEIDLRTGITKEQAESGQVVKICLDEIERCADSPIFFLGMLGNRYGWSEWIGDVDEDVLEDDRYSWIKQHADVSITELEIISAIERGGKHSRAFFYLKENKRDDDKKLIDLKERLIEKSKNDNRLYVAEYKDADEFRKRTIDAFKKILDELYPEDIKLSEVERLRTTHEIFSKSRQKVYISNNNEIILSEFIDSDKDRLLLYGESGYGKSALIANYFNEFKKNTDTFVIEHYIGGAGEFSSDLHQTLRRVMLEIKEEFDLNDEVPSEPQKIMDEFSSWLLRVKGSTIVIFDGYNQIEDEMKEKLFLYLPDKLKNVKLIFTSIQDDYDIEYKQKIEALNNEDQKKLIVKYQDEYGKTLEGEIVTQIVQHPQTDNTLFLYTLLTEIRLLGNHKQKIDDIASYLNAKNVAELFSKILERLERDYKTGLTREVLSLIYVSRDGLSENNLMEIMNKNSTKKVSRLEFSPLFLAIEEHLLNRDGLYGFFHGFIEEAVENRYLSRDELINVERSKIADYFGNSDIDNQRIRELPFQLFRLEDRDRLYECLFIVDFFIEIQRLDVYELLMYILFIEKKENLTQNIYNTLLDKRCQDSNKIDNVAKFFNTYGKYNKSIILYQKVLIIKKNLLGDKHKDIAKVYHDLAEGFRYAGKYTEALPFYNKSLIILKDLYGEEHYDIATSYNDLGLLYKLTGDYKRALPLYFQSLAIWRKLLGESHCDIATNYNNIAVLYKQMGRYKEALPFYEKALNLRQVIFTKNHPEISQSYNNLGGFYLDLKKYKQALFYYGKALDIRESVLGDNHPNTATVYNNIAVTYQEMGKFKEAYLFLKKDLKICEKLLGKKHPNTAISYHGLGKFYKNIGKYKKSLVLYKKDLKITMEILGKKHLNTAITYNSLAELYKLMKNFTKAKKFYKKALIIRENNLPNNHSDIIESKLGLEKLNKESD